MSAHVWVVEMLVGKHWQPTVGVSLSKAGILNVKRSWEKLCADDKFRVSKYVREGK